MFESLSEIIFLLEFAGKVGHSIQKILFTGKFILIPQFSKADYSFGNN